MGYFTIFGIPGPYWMLVADTVVLVSIIVALWRNS